MNALELILTLLIVVLIVVEVSGRIGIPYPILLVLGGVGLAAIPGLPLVELEPNIVLLLFLPPLLFIAAYVTPLRDLRANARPIALLSVGLVLFTIVVVGFVAHSLVPDMGWPAALALGAIVAPTDAIAATSIFRRLKVPRRIVTLLEGESLLNDASALVAYRAAVGAVAGTFVASTAAITFVTAAVGGIAVGVVVGLLFREIYRRLENPPVEVALSVVVPFAAYLPAERFGFSGVLAAVLAGLIIGRASARILSADTRVLGLAAWEMLSFVLNGFAFILIGLQLPIILSRVDTPRMELLGLAVAITLTVIVARFLWVFPATYLPRWVSAKIRATDPAPPPEAVFVISWAGLRGAVSLAAALALPIDFPQRALIQFLTFAVILGTLVGQGLTLPFLLRRFRLMDDGIDGREEVQARAVATTVGLAELARLRPLWSDHAPLFDRLESGIRDRHEHQPTDDEAESAERLAERREHEQIQHSVITAQRRAVIDLRDRGEINDQILRRVERELDLEEIRMEG